MKRNTLIALAIGILVIVIVGIVYVNRPTPDPTPKLKEVTINQAFEHLLYIGLYVAK